MRLDVVDLARFYATPMGASAQAMVQRRLQAVWPDARGLDVLGLGYATPFLEPYRAQARRVIAAMPAGQGVQGWPDAGHVASTLIAEDRLPFREAVFDRALVVHLLEEADALRPLLRELWRVTAPEARIVVIAANRLGLWARAESSPFGQGRSFSRRQLARLLGDAMFEPVRWARALHAPPVPWGPIVSAARAWEAVGEKVAPAFGGVVLVEALKRVAAETPRGGRRLLLAPAAAPAGAAHARDAATSLEQGSGAL